MRKGSFFVESINPTNNGSPAWNPTMRSCFIQVVRCHSSTRWKMGPTRVTAFLRWEMMHAKQLRPVTWQGTSRICPNQTTTLTGGRNIQRSRKSYYRNLGNAAASVTVSTRLAGTANNHTGRLSNLLIEIAGEVVLIAQVALVRKSRTPNGI